MEFLYSYLLVVIALLYSYYQHLGIEKTIAINSITAFVQLIALGFVLEFVFQANDILEISVIIFTMLFYGAYIANKRTMLDNLGYVRSFVVLAVCSFAIVGILVTLGLIQTKAYQLIPLFGMALGNALNVFSQLIERVKSDVRLSIDIIEGEIALGASVAQALSNSFKSAAKSALIPTLNQLQTVGIIQIPGVTVGMIMAGANPLDAVSFQLVIMFMMVAIAVAVAAISKPICSDAIFYSLRN